MGTVIVNGIEVEVGPKDNVVQAARRAGVEIPHYCWHPDLSVVASCRMCLVEVGELKPDGSIVMGPKLVPGCQTPAKPGTVIRTDTAKVKNQQGQTLEFLLLNHPLDCSICDQAGECYLQDYTYKYGRAHSRLQEPKVQRVDKYHIGEQIALFTDRCVMCTRCVRFTREVSGTAELHVISRGSVEEIDVIKDRPCNNKLAGNVVDLCPVGALCSKDFLYKKRVWWLETQNSVCVGCSTGCSIRVDQNENQVYRLRPRENPQAQGSFMCDDGRFGFKYIHSDKRLTAPRWAGQAPDEKSTKVKLAQEPGDVTGVAPDLVVIDPWPTAIQKVRSAIKETARRDGGRILAVLSPFMTCEEAFVLAKYLKGVDKRVYLTMGPVPVVGEDDLYPKNCKGEPPPAGKVKFTIRAEKCPNRLGVEAVLKHFQGEIIPYERAVQRMDQKLVDVAFIVGGYPEGGYGKELVSVMKNVGTTIVLDMMNSPVTDAASIVLAGGTFAERDGIVVNHAGLAQAIRPAVRCPGDARPDGRILMDLTERKGLFHSPSIRQEMASEIIYFKPLGNGEVGLEGKSLIVNKEPAMAKAGV